MSCVTRVKLAKQFVDEKFAAIRTQPGGKNMLPALNNGTADSRHRKAAGMTCTHNPRDIVINIFCHQLNATWMPSRVFDKQIIIFAQQTNCFPINPSPGMAEGFNELIPGKR